MAAAAGAFLLDPVVVIAGIAAGMVGGYQPWRRGLLAVIAAFVAVHLICTWTASDYLRDLRVDASFGDVSMHTLFPRALAFGLAATIPWLLARRERRKTETLDTATTS